MKQQCDSCGKWLPFYPGCGWCGLKHKPTDGNDVACDKYLAYEKNNIQKKEESYCPKCEKKVSTTCRVCVKYGHCFYCDTCGTLLTRDQDYSY